jgi:predicted RNA-binding protein with PUA-like domain
MAKWLLKEEPTHYSWQDLARDGRTEWDGVHNALALRHLRAMAPGVEAIYYHTGDVRSCIGVVSVTSTPHPDPGDERGSWSVEVRPGRPLARSVSLAEIRADPAFAGFALLRISRLSVLPVPDPMWKRILELSDRPATPVGAAATVARKGRAKASGSSRRGPARPRRR